MNRQDLQNFELKLKTWREAAHVRVEYAREFARVAKALGHAGKDFKVDEEDSLFPEGSTHLIYMAKNNDTYPQYLRLRAEYFAMSKEELENERQKALADRLQCMQNELRDCLQRSQETAESLKKLFQKFYQYAEVVMEGGE